MLCGSIWFHFIHASPRVFFPKQFTVGFLNATLDLAALVLAGVAEFLGSDVVLAPFGSFYGGGAGVVLRALKWSWAPFGSLPVVLGVVWCQLFGVYAGVISLLK